MAKGSPKALRDGLNRTDLRHVGIRRNRLVQRPRIALVLGNQNASGREKHVPEPTLTVQFAEVSRLEVYEIHCAGSNEGKPGGRVMLFLFLGLHWTARHFDPETSTHPTSPTIATDQIPTSDRVRAARVVRQVTFHPVVCLTEGLELHAILNVNKRIGIELPSEIGFEVVLRSSHPRLVWLRAVVLLVNASLPLLWRRQSLVKINTGRRPKYGFNTHLAKDSPPSASPVLNMTSRECSRGTPAR